MPFMLQPLLAIASSITLVSYPPACHEPVLFFCHSNAECWYQLERLGF